MGGDHAEAGTRSRQVGQSLRDGLAGGTSSAAGRSVTGR
jgi:hypothetical protein